MRYTVHRVSTILPAQKGHLELTLVTVFCCLVYGDQMVYIWHHIGYKIPNIVEKLYHACPSKRERFVPVTVTHGFKNIEDKMWI